jgi:hypothetical protein
MNAAARQAAPAAAAVSPFENAYGVFFEETIDRAQDAGRLMQDLNRAHQILSGLGVVLRIVAGNGALRDEYDPSVEAGAPPLTQLAEGQLVAMAATLCEQMRDQVEMRAMSYNGAHGAGDTP